MSFQYPRAPRTSLALLSLSSLLVAVPACTPSVAPAPAKSTAVEQAPARRALAITVDASKALRTVNKRRFLGSNIAVWHQPSTFENPAVRKLFADAGMGLLRLPGGSASDQYFWNGNGVRRGKVIDKSKYNQKDHAWRIDYSDWAPGFFGFFGFPKDLAKTPIQEWQGNCTVKDELEFAKAVGVETLITVNAGTGRPRDAAEWVKWANQKMKYGVKFWEVGNELGGSWESGTLRPDGKNMDGAMYGGIYEAFAKEIKAADPNALVGSQGGVDFIRGALEHKDAPVDFVTYHDYFNADNNPEAMFKVLDKIRPAISEVRDAVKALRPGQPILVGMTEFNCKLFEDENTADTNSGLWLLAALGEMMYGGLDFATGWDAFTQKKQQGGGHGFIIEEGAVPKAQYWTYHILNHYFADTILDIRSPDSPVRSYASKDASGNVFVLNVNTSQTEAFDASLSVQGAATGPLADCVRFSAEEYAWDPLNFAPIWNNGPTPMTVRVAGAPVLLPAASAVACRLTPAAKQPAKLAVQGATSTVLAAGGKTTVHVVAIDALGKPAVGTDVQATAPAGFAVEPLTAKTGPDGLAKFALTAPKAAGQAQLAFAANGFSAATQPLQTVEPTLVVNGPTKVPAGETAAFTAAARYKDGAQYKLVQTFSGEGSLVVAGMKGEKVQFVDGLANLAISSNAATTKSFKLTAAGLSSGADVTFFDRVTKELVGFRFDDAKSLEHASGKAKYKINENVRPNQGVLELPIDGCSGYAQDLIILDKLNEIPGIDRANIRGLKIDVMAADNVQTGSKYSELLFVLQGELNWWMPLDKIEIAKLPKNEWKTITLPITKAEWQKAMRAFVKMDVVVNSGDTQKGTLYFDNLTFIMETPK